MHFGLNISSLVILFKTVILTKLIYAAPVWLSTENQQRFKSLLARDCLKISGSTHYSLQSITLLALGMEQMKILYNITSTKFVLKALNSNNNMKSIMFQIEESRNHPFYQHVLMAKNYLTTKHGCFKERRNGNTNTLDTVDETLLVYSKSDMNSWNVKLWNDHLKLIENQKKS